jgi:eukaryotic-like serine/threonine-protein kinase
VSAPHAVVGSVIQLARRWTLGPQIGQGGFGGVFAATADDGSPAAVKLVRKAPGASRELLLVEGVAGARNIVPMLDSGETADAYVIVMPLAEQSLQDRLDAAGGPLPLEDALAVLTDVATALADLDGRVVHRDLKPANVLLVDGAWCLADFGISRYADATTAPDTRRMAMSPPYAAPERWRAARATAAADVYAVGVMAFQLLSGDLPFPGPGWEDFHDQHLHAEPPALATASPRLAALIEECLYKAPEARPVPANLLARLQKAAESTPTPGMAALAGAYQRHAEQRRADEVAASRAETEQERRRQLADSAGRSLQRTSTAMLETVTDLAPGAVVRRRTEGWSVELNGVQVGLSTSIPIDDVNWGQWPPPFDIIAAATISVVIPADRSGYAGRSHSLFYCDAQRPGVYGWFETAFMDTPFRRRVGPGQDPFALHPADPLRNGEAVGKALANAITHYQVAWPFTELVTGEAKEFIDRWVGWFAAGLEGQLSRPSTMPERPPEGSWRRS